MCLERRRNEKKQHILNVRLDHHLQKYFSSARMRHTHTHIEWVSDLYERTLNGWCAIINSPEIQQQIWMEQRNVECGVSRYVRARSTLFCAQLWYYFIVVVFFFEYEIETDAFYSKVFKLKASDHKSNNENVILMFSNGKWILEW